MLLYDVLSLLHRLDITEGLWLTFNPFSVLNSNCFKSDYSSYPQKILSFSLLSDNAILKQVSIAKLNLGQKNHNNITFSFFHHGLFNCSLVAQLAEDGKFKKKKMVHQKLGDTNQWDKGATLKENFKIV